ncbi:Protein FAR-RED IMPAIRED RESPONSE 1 [Bienertia sinuspersici]
MEHHGDAQRAVLVVSLKEGKEEESNLSSHMTAARLEGASVIPSISITPPQKNFAPTTAQVGVSSSFSGELCKYLTEILQQRVCSGMLSDDGNPTTPTQVDGRETATAVETRGTPKKGMTFDSLEALEKFYSSYGKACGFGVIRVGPKKDGNTNVKRLGKKVTPKGLKYNRVREGEYKKKCECEAGIAGYLNKDGLWEIHKVELTHKNHVPTPSKSRFIPSYRDVPKFVLRVAKDLMDAGVKQPQIYHALANQMNGFENLPFLLRDMHNVVGKERSKEFDETDCRAMFEYFAKMKEENEDFFFSWRVDEANKLMDVFWVGARSRVAYMDF